MKKLTILIASAFILYSCEKKTNTVETSQQTENPKVADSANPATKLEQSTSAPMSEIAANNSAAKPALNPAHGEPFHRCDIAVGAPIESAPQQNTQSQVLSPQGENYNNAAAPMIPVSSSSMKSNGTKPALNPAHGEPHHRCDLQVGAPLT